MPTPQQELAAALQRVRGKAAAEILRGPDIGAKDRVLLVKRGFLVKIIKGWYALTKPQSEPGDTTFWHAHFWGFASAYLRFRFGTAYCLSAEHSLDLWTGQTQTPTQLIVITGKGGGFKLELPNRTSLLFYPDRKNLPAETALLQGIQVMPVAVALARVTPLFYRQAPTSAEIALRLVRADDLSRILLSAVSFRTTAGRLIGAFRHCGLNEIAEKIAADLRGAGLDFEENNPFVAPPKLPPGLLFTSPYAGRLKAMWQHMRPSVLAHFPDAPKAQDPAIYLQQVEEIYTHDAYNSLSIEGYQVTPELIERIATGEWNPDADPEDQEQRNAMAAKGYREAFKLVTKSLQEILKGEPAAAIVSRDIPDWYRALFSPSVQSGLLPAHALAGTRNRAVFIRYSDHVPPPAEAVTNLLETLFELLSNEPHAGVRAVLGHFLFVYIHPYPDGNGRIGRFFMNAMLASGGYPWTVIRVENRKTYLATLEEASARQDIAPFTQFVATEMAASELHKAPKK
ncbi:MAG: Fic family protein [Lacunisphaera sp.]|nr:Fic family protein [Lacunisphaera sp.]